MVEFDTDIVDIEGAELDLDVVVDIVLEQNTVSAETRKARIQIPIRPIIDRQALSKIPIEISAPNWSTEEQAVTVEWEGPVLELASLETQSISVLITPPKTPPESGFSSLQYRDNVVPGSYTLIPDMSETGLAVVRESLPNNQLPWTPPPPLSPDMAPSVDGSEAQWTNPEDAPGSDNFSLPVGSENDTKVTNPQAVP